ncbi:hypothetical protein G8D98_03875 [Phycicoccus endophyticus]|nr:hypothetical protein [Phycicoccus endophyticus]
MRRGGTLAERYHARAATEAEQAEKPWDGLILTTHIDDDQGVREFQSLYVCAGGPPFFQPKTLSTPTFTLAYDVLDEANVTHARQAAMVSTYVRSTGEWKDHLFFGEDAEQWRPSPANFRQNAERVRPV